MPPTTTVRHQFVGRRADDPQLDLPVVEQQAVARACGADELGVRRRNAARGRPCASPAAMRSSSPARSVERRAARQGSGADLRSAQVLHDGDAASASCAQASRIGRERLRVRSRGCRARSSDGTHRRRPTSSARASRDSPRQGPTVATILVWRMCDGPMPPAHGSTSALVIRMASASASASFRR